MFRQLTTGKIVLIIAGAATVLGPLLWLIVGLTGGYIWEEGLFGQNHNNVVHAFMVQAGVTIGWAEQLEHLFYRCTTQSRRVINDS